MTHNTTDIPLNVNFLIRFIPFQWEVLISVFFLNLNAISKIDFCHSFYIYDIRVYVHVKIKKKLN